MNFCLCLFLAKSQFLIPWILYSDFVKVTFVNICKEGPVFSFGYTLAEQSLRGSDQLPFHANLECEGIMCLLECTSPCPDFYITLVPGLIHFLGGKYTVFGVTPHLSKCI